MLKKIYFLVFGLLFAVSTSFATASEEANETHKSSEHAKFTPGEFIFDHINNSYCWHIMTIGEHHVSLYLPIIVYSEQSGWHVFSSSHLYHSATREHDGLVLPTDGKLKNRLVEIMPDGTQQLPLLDISITKLVFAMLCVMTLLTVLMLYVAKQYKKGVNRAPHGLQLAVEPLIVMIRDDIAKPSIGEERYQKFMPYLLTVFFFIFISNYMGLIPILPGGSNLTGNISVTMTLAVLTFLITTFSTNRGYWLHVINTPGVPWWLKFPVPLMPVIEIIGIILKPIVLMLRLTANMTAGHLIALSFVGLIFIFAQINVGAGLGISVMSIAFMLFMGLLEVLVALIQAYVFTMLSALYFGMARVDSHHH